MVDNENQWDDMEYSEEQAEEEAYEYEDDSSEDMGYSEEDDSYEEYDEDEEVAPRKSNPLPVILVLLLLLGAVAFFLVPKFMGANQSASNNEVNSVQTVEQDMNSGIAVPSQGGDDLANSFFNDAGGENTDMISVDFNENGETNVATGQGENAQIATVTEVPAEEGVSESDLFVTEGNDNSIATGEENNSIMVVYNKASRMNPFKPPLIEKTAEDAFETINDTQFEIIEPPTTSVPDENLTRLLQTQISGILFDEVSPSAIVNLNGLDQFVKVGDVVSGYRIESITRDKVQIGYKSNSYVAAVGELFTRGTLEKNPAVVNLENKFAGRYKNQE